jgi:hypothetical protein
MKSVSIVFVSSTLAALIGAACTINPPRENQGVSESLVSAADVAQARSVLALLGGSSGTCNGCHGASPDSVRQWGQSMLALQNECFAANGTKTASQRVDCLRGPDGFNPSRIGLWAAAPTTAEFGTLFNDAFGPTVGAAKLDELVQQAAMPQGGGNALTGPQWQNVKSWVLSGMPGFDEASGRGAIPGPDAGAESASCIDQVDPALASHVKTMAKEGWAARHREQSIVMFGCGAATNPLDCLKDLPDATSRFSAANVAQVIRELRAIPFTSHYWTRSSVDGRYIGLGLNSTSGSRIIDLTKPATAPAIAIAAKYDPVFFPSNDGFSFAGALSDNALHVCRMSLLADAAKMAAPVIALNEAKCTTLTKNVYQSIGAALDGSRYFVSIGVHENDDGGNATRAPLAASYGPGAKTAFIPMVNDGVAFVAQSPVELVLPNEGDLIQSASSRAFATRLSNGSKQIGYGVHLLKASGSGATLSLEAPTVARLCGKGGKPEFSMDERFLAYHEYVGAGEALPTGSANIVIVDLLNGTKRRITENKAGVYALYPQFRADGWLHFLVRDTNTKTETMFASDVAIR